MKKSFLYSILFLSFAGSLIAQQFVPPSNQNAALRYWMAFADLVDRPADEATNKAIDDVLSGAATWDEAKLGPILDANDAAVRSLQRATRLPDCNWGLEYDRGFAMSLGHLPKARVIARLNALYGARQMAKGDPSGAVDTWLAGLRFAQHVGKDVSLIGTLSARPAFTANLHLLARAAQDQRLSADLQVKIREQLKKLPADGLDWSGPVRAETWADEDSLKHLANASNFAQTYRDFFGSAPANGVQAPTPQDIAAFHALMNDVIAAFQLPAAQTKEKLADIMARARKLSASSQAVIPNYQRTNDARIQVSGELESLVKGLK